MCVVLVWALLKKVLAVGTETFKEGHFLLKENFCLTQIRVGLGADFRKCP